MVNHSQKTVEEHYRTRKLKLPHYEKWYHSQDNSPQSDIGHHSPTNLVQGFPKIEH
jgi:hypothetical protein